MKRLAIILLVLLSTKVYSQNLRLEFNSTNSVKTVSLNGVYVDMKGVVRVGSIDIKPHCSVVLIKTSGPLAIKLLKYDVVAKDHIITINFTIDEDGVAKDYVYIYDNRKK